MSKKSFYLGVPGLLMFTVFFLLPTIGGLLLAFVQMKGLRFETMTFAGFDNFITVFSEKSLRIALKNSFIFAFLSTVLKVTIGLCLALLLNNATRSAKALRGIFFLPAVINTVAVGVIFTSLMHPTTGLINETLDLVNLSGVTQNWLTDKDLAIYSVSIIETWKWSGFTMAILLAGLQGIPDEYYEAANIDGANSFHKFRYVTFPLLLPSFNNALIINLIGGLKVFDLVQATTGGGPGLSTQVFGTLIFKAFGSGRYAEGAAASVILGLIITCIAIPLYRFIAGKEVEQ